jgi:ATP-binding protein involved in chromosome partitioning
VTTPSDVALLDARRAIGMFERVGVPVIGVVENMSHFVCPHCSKATDVFSHGGAATIAREAKVPLLGEIPLHAAICHGGDHGRPVMVEAPEGAEARAFVELAGKVRIFLDAAERLRAPLH